jgi:hypothetical protein
MERTIMGRTSPLAMMLKVRECLWAGDTRPPAVGQIVAAPSGSRQKKKHVSLASKNKQPIPSADQVTTHIKLPLYCGPQSPLDLVAIEIDFGCLFEAF